MKIARTDNFDLDKYTKTLNQLSNMTYLGPFKATGYYVDDRRGDTVVECNNTDLAKILVELLNNLPSPELLEKSELKQDLAKVELQVKPVEKIALTVKEETTEAKIKKLL